MPAEPHELLTEQGLKEIREKAQKARDRVFAGKIVGGIDVVAVLECFDVVLADNDLLRRKCEDLQEQLAEANRQYIDEKFPVWQSCETCGPSALDESGKCPKCGQVYDFKRWRNLTAEIDRLKSQLTALENRVSP